MNAASDTPSFEIGQVVYAAGEHRCRDCGGNAWTLIGLCLAREGHFRCRNADCPGRDHTISCLPFSWMTAQPPSDLTVEQITDLLRTCNEDDFRNICHQLVGWADADSESAVHVREALGEAVNGAVQIRLKAAELAAEAGAR